MKGDMCAREKDSVRGKSMWLNDNVWDVVQNITSLQKKNK